MVQEMFSKKTRQRRRNCLDNRPMFCCRKLEPLASKTTSNYSDNMTTCEFFRGVLKGRLIVGNIYFYGE